MSNITAEIRWFAAGSLPTSFLAWFSGQQTVTLDQRMGEQRLDRYMHISGQRVFSLKQREGSAELEIKGLVERADYLDFGTFNGEIEIWAKWRIPPLVISPAITVHKHRWLRTFDTTPATPLEVESADLAIARHDPPRIGCQVELTHITLPDHAQWWTIGLEAFGPRSSVEKSLRLLAQHLECGQRSTGESIVCSSYAQWLSRLPSPNC